MAVCGEQTPSSTMNPDDRSPSLNPDQVLELHDSVRARVKRDTAPFFAMWFPLAAFGALSVVSSGVAALGGATAFEVYWGVCGPVGLAVVMAYYWRLEEHSSLRVANLRRSAAIAATVVVGAFAIVAADVGPAGPFFGVAIGYLAFAVLVRSRVMLFSAVGCGVVAAVVGVVDPTQAEVWLGLGVGAIQLAGAAAERRLGIS